LTSNLDGEFTRLRKTPWLPGQAPIRAPGAGEHEPGGARPGVVRFLRAPSACRAGTPGRRRSRLPEAVQLRIALDPFGDDAESEPVPEAGAPRTVPAPPSRTSV